VWLFTVQTCDCLLELLDESEAVNKLNVPRESLVAKALQQSSERGGYFGAALASDKREDAILRDDKEVALILGCDNEATLGKMGILGERLCRFLYLLHGECAVFEDRKAAIVLCEEKLQREH
jgi:hypothetical protein